MLGKSIPWKFVAQNIDKWSQKNSLDWKWEDEIMQQKVGQKSKNCPKVHVKNAMIYL